MNRVDKLKAIIRDSFAGNNAAFAKQIGRSPSQVSQWVNGYRVIGDAGARIIETSLGLSQGYFDDPTAVQTYRAPDIQQRAKREHDRPLVQQVCDLAETINDDGLKEIIGYIKCMANTHPLKQTPAQSNKAA